MLIPGSIIIHFSYLSPRSGERGPDAGKDDGEGFEALLDPPMRMMQ
ncbi:hypothetical protein SLEP1_g17478 [Rubroshorea leprosula]|uniref:Uncharacterized protein n=1 Tax=Rubroshorea leprosula TaxID=152421 RepID=A0AAV5J096_9ROSI|nr:hypothetical protein SLEP1_g17478 [Rubroshorea leprosula]